MPQMKNTTSLLKPREDNHLNTMVTPVQITPLLRAPVDITDAIRRQRRTRGVDYLRSSTTGKQPVLRAVVSDVSSGTKGRQATGPLSPRGGHASDVIGLSVQGFRSPEQPDTSRLNLEGDPRTPRPSSLHGEGAYSFTYNNHGYTINARFVNKQAKSSGSVTNGVATLPKVLTENNMPRTSPRPMKLKLPHKRKPSSVSTSKGLEKSVSLNGLDPPNSERETGHLQSNEIDNKDESNPFTPAPSRRPNESTNANQSPVSSDEDSNPRPSGGACLTFADTILDAVSSDLSHMYDLCNARVNYSEFIETNEPHRLGAWKKTPKEAGDSSAKDSPVTHEADHGVSSTKSKPQRLSYSHSLSSSTYSPTSPFATPTRVKLFPPFNGRTRNQVIPNAFTDPTILGTPIAFPDPSPYGKGPDNAKKEVSIDYDKPVKIIIESNEDDSGARFFKPILKQISRGNPTNNNRHSDRNNNDIPSSFDSKTPKSTPRSHGPTTRTNLFDTPDKGRLVRFSAQHRIHEFAPSEPVNPSELVD